MTLGNWDGHNGLSPRHPLPSSAFLFVFASYFFLFWFVALVTSQRVPDNSRWVPLCLLNSTIPDGWRVTINSLFFLGLALVLPRKKNQKSNSPRVSSSIPTTLTRANPHGRVLGVSEEERKRGLILTTAVAL